MTQTTDEIKLPHIPKADNWTTGCKPEYTLHTIQDYARAAVLADRERQQQKLPANWDEDSSLETWFPLTAEELERLRAENAELRKDAKRYRYLRSRDLNAIEKGGIFVGLTPDNIVLNEEDLDAAIDAAMAREAERGN